MQGGLPRLEREPGEPLQDRQEEDATQGGCQANDNRDGSEIGPLGNAGMGGEIEEYAP
jgi:hypothetical protein